MILGLDPGLARCGWALLTHNAAVVSLGTWTSDPGDLEPRAHELAGKLWALLAEPRADPIRLVVAESLATFGAKRAIATLSLAWGVVATACAVAGLPLLSVRPQVWQQACAGGPTGKRGTPYSEIAQRLEDYALGAGGMAALSHPDMSNVDHRGHAIDALGVALWGAIRGGSHRPIGITQGIVNTRSRGASKAS